MRVPCGGSAVVGPSWRLRLGVAEEARTRGFAAPACAGCAFVEGWYRRATGRYANCQANCWAVTLAELQVRGRSFGSTLRTCTTTSPTGARGRRPGKHLPIGLALLYALEHPRDVDRLVLIGTRAFPSTGGADPVYALNRTPIIGALFRHTALLPVGRILVKRRPASESKRLATAIPGAQLVVVPETGHEAQLTHGNRPRSHPSLVRAGDPAGKSGIGALAELISPTWALPRGPALASIGWAGLATRFRARAAPR
jgi:hypothetical protein